MAEVALAALAAEAREAIDNEDFDRAARACLRALRRFPRWVEGYWLLGQVLIEREYATEARACFEAVASAEPDDPRAYEGLAAVAEQRRDLATAIAGLARAVEVGETSQGVQGELNNLLRQAGRSGLELATNARAAHARLLDGQFEAADLAAERALREEPDRLDLLLVQTVARLLGDDRGGALSSGERLLELSPDCLKALTILQHLTSGQRQEGYAAELTALDPEGHTLVWLHGQIAARGGNVGELPAEPRVITWTEDMAESTLLAGRPLDRLLPELEQALPQWLRDAAAAPAAEPALATPVPPAEPAAAETGLPSVLSDVESLVREFEEALQASPPPSEAKAASASPAAETEPAAASAAADAPAPAASQRSAEPLGADNERRAAAEAMLSSWDAAPPNQAAPSHVEAGAAEAAQPVSAPASQTAAGDETWGAAADAAAEWTVQAPAPADDWAAVTSNTPAASQPAADEFGLPIAAADAGATPTTAEFVTEQHADASLAPEAAHPEYATVARASEAAASPVEPPALSAWEASGAPSPAVAAGERTDSIDGAGAAAEEVPPLVNIADWETPPVAAPADYAAGTAESAAEEPAPTVAANTWEHAGAASDTSQAATEPPADSAYATAPSLTASEPPAPAATELNAAASAGTEQDKGEIPSPATAAPPASTDAGATITPVAAAAPATSDPTAASDQLRVDAYAAAHAGEYLTAVAMLGDALAALRGVGSGHGER